MNRLSSFISVAIFFFAASTNGNAFEKRHGCFQAEKSCPAFRSIRKQTNPGNISVQSGKVYPLEGQNKRAATHYQIRIEGSANPMRWVEVSCGKVLETCPGEKAGARQPGKFPRGSYAHPDYQRQSGKTSDLLLAFSWEPAFCETHRKKKECKSLTAERFDAMHFSLHGLWNQPRGNTYCNVSVRDKSVDRRKRWDLLAKLELTEQTRSELEKVMPGTQSYLHRHEWTKHGTCYKGHSAEVYYRHSLQLMRAINTSPLQKLFQQNIGKKLHIQKIREVFDTAFGRDAGRRLQMRCDRKKRITEFWLNLNGPVNQGSNLSDLIKAAPKRKQGCREGIVDAAGYAG